MPAAPNGASVTVKRPPPATILVTGASGFVGQATCRHLLAAGHDVRALHGRHPAPPGTRAIPVDLANCCDWDALLEGASAVVHLAGMAHVPVGQVAHAMLWHINVEATAHLARATAAAGVRMVFVSSAKVLGAAGTFTAASPPQPPDIYAASKWAAEQALLGVPDLDFVILRPPLVYGPGVGANFLRLLKLMDSGLPLPFAAVAARRSLIGVDNLADAIVTCLFSAGAGRRTYLLADGAALALNDLLRQIAAALGRPARLLPLPQALLNVAFKTLRQEAAARRLFDDLVVDDRAFRSTYGWQPPLDFAQGLQQTCAWFRCQLA